MKLAAEQPPFCFEPGFAILRGMMKLLRKYVFAYTGDLRPLAEAVKPSISLRGADRISLLVVVLGLLTALTIWRLFSLQIVDYPFYAALASDQHQIQKILNATRGEIIVRDHAESEAEFPLALNKDFQIYAVPQQIKDPQATAEKLRAAGECGSSNFVGKVF